jgi:hypothetical protein
MSLVFAAAFAAMIVINYSVQTTLVPGLVSRYTAADAPVVAAFTLSNPTSLGWALEMWGYALLGVAAMMAATLRSRAR